MRCEAKHSDFSNVHPHRLTSLSSPLAPPAQPRPRDGVTHSRIPTLCRRDNILSLKPVPEGEPKTSIPPCQLSSTAGTWGTHSWHGTSTGGSAAAPCWLPDTSTSPHLNYQSIYENKNRRKPWILDCSHEVCSLCLPESTRMAVYYLIVNYTFLLDFRC